MFLRNWKYIHQLISIKPSYKKTKVEMFEQVPIVIGPSILSADFGNLHEDCVKILEAGSDSLHIDIMDMYFLLTYRFQALCPELNYRSSSSRQPQKETA